MQVELVRPPTVTDIGVKGQIAVPPIGLAYIAGSLRAAGHSVKALDAVTEAVGQYLPLPGVRAKVAHGLTPSQIAERIAPQTQLVGLTSMFSMQWGYERQVVEAIRAARPEVTIVLGGEHASACWHYLLESCPAIDACVLGEGEETIVALADALAAGDDLRQVSGLALRIDGQPQRTAHRARIREIDQIPAPAWDLFPIETYISEDLTWGVTLGRSMPILASRGCPYQCTFCSSPQMWSTYWNVRSPESVIAEIRRYMKDYGATSFSFYDLTAIVRRDWIVAFTNLLIEQQLDITWQLPSGTRTEVIDDEVARLLYRSGCRHLNYAPESGSPAVLQRIKKKVQIERMLDSMRASHRAGLKTKINMIFGFPQDSPREVLQSLAFVLRAALAGAHDMGPYLFSPYPGTALFDQLAEQGRLQLDEAYFEQLMTFDDPAYKLSFAERFSARQLNRILWLSIAVFYTTSFLRRPWRLFGLVYNRLTNQAQTKLEKQLAHSRRKRDALRLLETVPSE